MARIVRTETLTSEKLSIADAYEIFLGSRKTQCAEKTYKIYSDLGKRFIVSSLSILSDTGYMEDLSPVAIRTSLQDYALKHTKGGKSFIYRHMKVFINWYWNEYQLTIPNPIKGIKIQKQTLPPKPGITRAEVDKLLHTAKSQAFPERDIAVIMLLCDTGIRFSSLMGLKIKDVNIANSQIVVFEKDQDYHIKSFGTSTGRALKRYLNCLSDVKSTDTLWYSFDGNPLTEAGMKNMLVKLCEKAGIQRHLFHDFRRFYGLELYRATGDIYFVSRALDHKDVEVTKRYLAIDALEDAEATRLLSPMDVNMATINRKRNR